MIFLCVLLGCSKPPLNDPDITVTLSIWEDPSPAPQITKGIPTPTRSSKITIVADQIHTKEPQTDHEKLEYPVKIIPIAGPLSEQNAEISGMAWYRDELILLPQYPDRFNGGLEGALFAISKKDLQAFLAGDQSNPLYPKLIPFVAPGLRDKIDGFEGFEAIAFSGERVMMTIEASQDGMVGFLVAGNISPDLSEVRLESDRLAVIKPQANLSNFSDEAIFIANDQVFTLYEANGINVNPGPVAHYFSLNLDALGTIPFPTIEYRITDATPLDSRNQFWAINYFFPGDTKLLPAIDSLVINFGEGVTHAQSTVVERLVQFQYSPAGIVLTDHAPIQLELLRNDQARNWEALEQLDDMGFILATDKFPETLLGFVAYP
jgi:hypothetical protein